MNIRIANGQQTEGHAIGPIEYQRLSMAAFQAILDLALEDGDIIAERKSIGRGLVEIELTNEAMFHSFKHQDCEMKRVGVDEMEISADVGCVRFYTLRTYPVDDAMGRTIPRGEQFR